MKESKSKLFKQRLFRGHVSVGISISLLLYVSVFFGIFTIMLPYIQTWEKPSRHIAFADITKINYNKMINEVLKEEDYPQNDIYIQVPGYRNDPTLRITHRFMAPRIFDPISEEKLKDEGKNSQLGRFLNLMHYGRPLGFIARLIFGFMAVAAMFLILGGILLVFTFKFQDKGKNQQANFSKWHRKIFIYIFPIFLLIILAGALMNIGYKGVAPLTYIISKTEHTNFFTLTDPILLKKEKDVEKLNIKAEMLEIKELIKKVQKINPKMNIQEFKLINWNDKSARIEFIGFNPYKPFLNGVYNKPKVILSSVDASLIKEIKVLDNKWSVLLNDGVYFLHLLYGTDIYLRVFIALIMISSCFALGFAVMLYLEKIAKKYENKIPFYHWLGKISLACIIGLFPATALLFNLQWLLSFDLENRVLIQQAIFFNFWLATLTWSFYRINSYKASKELLFLAGFLFLLAPIIHFYFSGFTPYDLYEKKLTNILAVDITLIILAFLLLFIAYKLPKKREEAKLFWNKNYKGLKNE